MREKEYDKRFRKVEQNKLKSVKMAFAGLKKQINKANQVSAQIKNALISSAEWKIGSWTSEKRDGFFLVKIAQEWSHVEDKVKLGQFTITMHFVKSKTMKIEDDFLSFSLFTWPETPINWFLIRWFCELCHGKPNFSRWLSRSDLNDQNNVCEINDSWNKFYSRHVEGISSIDSL